MCCIIWPLLCIFCCPTRPGSNKSVIMFTNRPSSAPPFAFPVAPPFAAPKAKRTPSFHTKGNCLHLSGVEGPLGLRINGIFSSFQDFSSCCMNFPAITHANLLQVSTLCSMNTRTIPQSPAHIITPAPPVFAQFTTCQRLRGVSSTATIASRIGQTRRLLHRPNPFIVSYPQSHPSQGILCAIC
jgi:hypothetical protein